uniref:Uncharacterized protein n=1 Tax=Human herpesvirus 2 TaxID=10310 RepID=A0A481T4D1_HHV2|nr:hypothetical protein [Human alphaherpesvirus 2]
MGTDAVVRLSSPGGAKRPRWGSLASGVLGNHRRPVFVSRQYVRANPRPCKNHGSICSVQYVSWPPATPTRTPITTHRPGPMVVRPGCQSADGGGVRTHGPKRLRTSEAIGGPLLP